MGFRFMKQLFISQKIVVVKAESTPLIYQFGLIKLKHEKNCCWSVYISSRCVNPAMRIVVSIEQLHGSSCLHGCFFFSSRNSNDRLQILVGANIFRLNFSLHNSCHARHLARCDFSFNLPLAIYRIVSSAAQ